jgi:hypothetical protein
MSHSGGVFDRCADSQIGSTTADVTGHRFIDRVIVWLGILFQQRRGTHDLPGLAVTALGDIVITPRFL